MPDSHEHIHKHTLTRTYIHISTECPKLKPVFENEINIECNVIPHYHSNHVPNRLLINVCELVQCVITEGDRNLFSNLLLSHIIFKKHLENVVIYEKLRISGNSNT
jgi:hypothetical protein